MSCPDCGSQEKIVDSGQIFCKKCGLELNEFITTTVGKSFKQELEISRLNFKIDPKQELYALKLGLKNNQLREGWQKTLGFSLKEDCLKPELKEKALHMIKRAFEIHNETLVSRRDEIKVKWERISAKFLIELEKEMDLIIENEFDCYLSLVARNGFHNSSKDFIIINIELGNKTNYVIAHEIFQIQFRKYVQRFFKQGYGDVDHDISKVLAAFVLLDQDKIRSCFPEMGFTLDIFSNEKFKALANRIKPIWEKHTSFKELMLEIYRELDQDKLWVSY